MHHKQEQEQLEDAIDEAEYSMFVERPPTAREKFWAALNKKTISPVRPIENKFPF